MAILPAAWGVLGWRQRWIADDGLIVARTVREILAGNGPVFNPGERVEADTSVLWTWLLALVTWVSRLGLDTVIIGSGLLLAPLGLLFALLGARELHRRHSPDQVLLPLGALVGRPCRRRSRDLVHPLGPAKTPPSSAGSWLVLVAAGRAAARPRRRALALARVRRRAWLALRAAGYGRR